MSAYSGNPELNCDCYIALPLPECCNLRLPQLVNGQTYIVYIEDKFGNQEVQTLVAANGYVTIDISQFPDAWMNQYSGDFILWAYNSLDLDTEVSFTFNAIDYQCILLRFIHQSPIPTYAIIG